MTMTVELKKTYYTPAEVGRGVGVSRQTVVGWIRSGRLKADRTPGGHWRIPAELVDVDGEHAERVGG